MRQILLLVLWLSAATIFAQITVTKDYFPTAGDSLRVAVDNLPANVSIGPGGADLRWDFTSLQSPFTRQIHVRPASQGERTFDFPNADLFTPLSDEAEVYYRVTSGEFQTVGIFGKDPFGFGIKAITRFSPPATERRSPLNYGDENTLKTNFFYTFSADDLPDAVLNQLPITPDSIRIRIAIERKDEVDAWGKLTIPGGMYDVLREKRTEVQEARLDAKFGFIGWQDITNLVPNADFIGKRTSVSYHFHSNEAKEIIAIVNMDESDQRAVRVEYKANNLSTNIQDVKSLKPGVYAYPNPAIVNVRFEFSNLPAGNYKLTIFNILGVEVWSQHYFIDGQRLEKVDISSLRKGTYLYSLRNEAGKTISTKRLVVVRP